MGRGGGGRAAESRARGAGRGRAAGMLRALNAQIDISRRPATPR